MNHWRWLPFLLLAAALLYLLYYLPHKVRKRRREEAARQSFHYVKIVAAVEGKTYDLGTFPKEELPDLNELWANYAWKHHLFDKGAAIFARFHYIDVPHGK